MHEDDTRVDATGDSRDSRTAAGARRVAAVRWFNQLSQDEARALVEGLRDIDAGLVRPLAAIDDETPR